MQVSDAGPGEGGVRLTVGDGDHRWRGLLQRTGPGWQQRQRPGGLLGNRD